MELVLKYPDKYEKHIETKVERQNGSDWHNFPSFWMWAIQTQRWAVVPSNDGPRPVDSVWILHKDQRRSFVDEKLLVVLPEQFYRNCSRGVITALGVHSPDNAPVERIASELHRAAERLPVGDQEKGRAKKVLIQTLYEWLNERCETYDYEFQEKPDLECLLRRPLPLVKGEHFEPVDMKNASCIYLNDDPQRSPYITGFTDGYALPISAKSGFKALFQELRNLLGNDRVRRVSEERIEVGFLKSPVMRGGVVVGSDGATSGYESRRYFTAARGPHCFRQAGAPDGSREGGVQTLLELDSELSGSIWQVS